jgi:hypothetical protein
MRTTSRMIVAVLFGFGLALFAGCGSKPAPPNPDGGNGEPTPEPKPVVGPATYETDTAKHAIPSGPVAGMLGGAAAVPEAAVEGEYLKFRTPKPGTPAGTPPIWDREVWLKLRSSPSQPLLEGKRTVRLEDPVGPAVPEVHLSVPGAPTRVYANGYALTLELEPRKAGKVAGKIYVCLPDDEKSLLAGAFVASAPRQPSELPGAEDVPLINGSVTVRGARADTVLRVGYGGAGSAQPEMMTFPLGSTEIQLGDPIDPLRWNQTSVDPPSVTSLIAGNGKDVPSRYEHSKLTPGRYLVFAQLKDGPAAWKWVTVQAQSTIAVDLTIDAAQVGGVEVTTPLGTFGKVQMVPAENAGQPVIDPVFFMANAMNMQLECDIIVRKALFKNLAPGRYEVRAGNDSRFVEIVAGKTVELDFDKPVPPPKK